MGKDHINFWNFFLALVHQQLRHVSWVTFIVGIIALAIIIHMICLIISRLKEKPISWTKQLLLFSLFGYLSFVFEVTFFDRKPGSREGIATNFDWGNLAGNFMGVQQVIYNMLNIILFVPLGFLLAMSLKKEFFIKRFVMVFLYCFIISFFIETMQLITDTGFFEVSDIATNVFGGVLGCIIQSAGFAILQLLSKKTDKS